MDLWRREESLLMTSFTSPPMDSSEGVGLRWVSLSWAGGPHLCPLYQSRLIFVCIISLVGAPRLVVFETWAYRRLTPL